MVVVEDLEGVVTKLTWLAKVRSRAWISMKLLLVDRVDHPLGPKGTGVISVEFISNTSTCVNCVIIRLVGNLNGVVL